VTDTTTVNNNQLSFMSADRLISENLDNQAKDIYFDLLGEIENRYRNII
jgi:hypothetical protein